MKHSFSVTVLLLSFFLVAQLFGLYLLTQGVTVAVDEQTGETIATYEDTALGERPAVSGVNSVIYLVGGVFIATALLFFIMRFKFGSKMWQVWYGLAVVFTITASLGVFTHAVYAMWIAIALMLLKLQYRTILTHNVTELLVYAGIGLILAPLFELIWVFVLLGIISIYDMYAVWKSKHMIKLAKFTTKSNIFAGFLIPYGIPSKKGTTPMRTAILGGGDVVFPLIFLGSVLTNLLIVGIEKTQALALTSMMAFIITMSLALLFYFGKKNRFYPAMPFISMGCIVSYLFLLIIL